MHRILSLHYPRTRAFRLTCRAALAAVVAAVGSGCTRTGPDPTAAAAEKQSPEATAYVAVPEDARFGSRVYTGSGREVAALVARALSPRFRRVEIAPGEQPQAAASAEARAGGFTYLIRPSIIRWEDHPTAWSGGPDRARILLEVIDTATGDAADVAVVEARGAETASPVGVVETPAAGLEMPLQAYTGRLLPAPAAAAQK